MLWLIPCFMGVFACIFALLTVTTAGQGIGFLRDREKLYKLRERLFTGILFILVSVFCAFAAFGLTVGTFTFCDYTQC